jgi:hypothetical protein
MICQSNTQRRPSEPLVGAGERYQAPRRLTGKLWQRRDQVLAGPTLKPALQRVLAIRHVQVDFGIDGEFGELDLPLLGNEPDRAFEAG